MQAVFDITGVEPFFSLLVDSIKVVARIVHKILLLAPSY